MSQKGELATWKEGTNDLSMQKTVGWLVVVKPTFYIDRKKLPSDEIAAAILFKVRRQSQRDVSIGDKKQED